MFKIDGIFLIYRDPICQENSSLINLSDKVFLIYHYPILPMNLFLKNILIVNLKWK
jgi:hypothetical protein